jgi:hypothetical protein
MEHATVLQAAIDENEEDDGDDNSPGDTDLRVAPSDQVRWNRLL